MRLLESLRAQTWLLILALCYAFLSGLFFYGVRCIQISQLPFPKAVISGFLVSITFEVMVLLYFSVWEFERPKVPKIFIVSFLTHVSGPICWSILAYNISTPEMTAVAYLVAECMHVLLRGIVRIFITEGSGPFRKDAMKTAIRVIQPLVVNYSRYWIVVAIIQALYSSTSVNPVVSPLVSLLVLPMMEICFGIYVVKTTKMMGKRKEFLHCIQVVNPTGTLVLIKMLRILDKSGTSDAVYNVLNIVSFISTNLIPRLLSASSRRPSRKVENDSKFLSNLVMSIEQLQELPEFLEEEDMKESEADIVDVLPVFGTIENDAVQPKFPARLSVRNSVTKKVFHGVQDSLKTKEIGEELDVQMELPPEMHDRNRQNSTASTVMTMNPSSRRQSSRTSGQYERESLQLAAPVSRSHTTSESVHHAVEKFQRSRTVIRISRIAEETRGNVAKDALLSATTPSTSDGNKDGVVAQAVEAGAEVEAEVRDIMRCDIAMREMACVCIVTAFAVVFVGEFGGFNYNEDRVRVSVRGASMLVWCIGVEGLTLWLEWAIARIPPYKQNALKLYTQGPLVIAIVGLCFAALQGAQHLYPYLD